MPAEIILSSKKRVELYNNLKIGDSIKIIGGKNKGKIGIVKTITHLSNDEYGGYKNYYCYDNYFSVYFTIEGDSKVMGTSCNYVRKI
jgi:hypothetical protein